MKYDVVIIGSGLGGLECAHILSRAGMSVLVLERGTQMGGCLQSYKRKGMSFDTGFHYVGGLGEGQSLHAAFKCLGLLRLPWRRLDEHFDKVTIGGRTFAFAQGYDAFAATLQDAFPAEREGLRCYVDLLKRVGDEQFAPLNPAVSLDSPSSELVDQSAWQYLNETFRDPLLINVLSGTSLKMELRQESLPLFTFAHSNGGFIEGSWRLQGDGGLIADSLASDIRSYGGNILCRAEVEELIEKDGKLVATRCSNGEVYEGDVFISDIHPALTCGLVRQSERIKKVYRTRMNHLENTFGFFTVSLLLKPGRLRYRNWNDYVYRNPDVWTFYQDNSPVGGVLISSRVPEDGSEYVRQMDLLTPMTWDKCAQWADTEVGKRGEDYLSMKRRLADECVALAEQVIPGLRDAVETYYTDTPLTYRDYTLTPEGSAYGVRKDFREPLITMLSPRTPIPNLYLTGQGLMLHGLHGVTMTAFFTCAEVIGKVAVWNRLKENGMR